MYQLGNSTVNQARSKTLNSEHKKKKTDCEKSSITQLVNQARPETINNQHKLLRVSLLVWFIT